MIFYLASWCAEVVSGQSWSPEAGVSGVGGSDVCPGPPVDTDLHRASNRASHIAHREEITQIPGHFSSQNVAQAKHSVR